MEIHNETNLLFQKEKHIKNIIEEKLINIHAEGTAYSALFVKKHFDFDALSKILREGILGSYDWYKKFPEINKEGWYKAVRKNKDCAPVFFNILDRSVNKKREYVKKIVDTPRLNELDNIFIMIFDISLFKEVTPQVFNMLDPGKIFTFCSDDFAVSTFWKENFNYLQPGEQIITHPAYDKARKKELIDDKGKPKSDGEYGFVLYSRVSPRLFRGIVLKSQNQSQDYIKEITNQTYTTMYTIYQNNPQLFIPVYNQEGIYLPPQLHSKRF